MSESLFSSLPLTVAANKREEFNRKHGTTNHKARDTGGLPVQSQKHHGGSNKRGQLGMHISAIRKFLKDHPDVVIKDLTTSQTNRAVVRPETQGTNKPYIYKYKGCRDASGIPLVAPATVFVSHAWKYNFASIVVAVMEQHAKDEPDAYFWFDMFTNDQNAVCNKDFDWFSNTFKDSIRSIGQVLLVLSPWNDPIPLTRAWCLFEISTVLDQDDLAFSIHLPDSQVDLMAKAVIDDTDCLIGALAHIQAEKAQATSEDDRIMIFDVVSKSKGGFQHLNNQVKHGLREWYVEQLRLALARSPQNTDLSVAVSDITLEFGFDQVALEIAESALKLVEDDTSAAMQCGSLHHTIGNISRDRGNDTLALQHYEKALVIYIGANGEDDPRVNSIYSAMGNSYRRKCEYDKAEEYGMRSLNMRMKKYGERDGSVAQSFQNIGNVYHDKKELDKSLEYYLKALDIALEKDGDKHLDTGFLYHDIAMVHGNQGNLEKCEEYYMKSLAITKATLGERHRTVAVIYNKLADMNRAKGELSLAMEYSQKALSIMLETHGENHPEVGTSYGNMGILYGLMKKPDEAREYLAKAVTIKENMYGEDYLHSVNPLMGIAMLDMDQGRSLDIVMLSLNKALRIREKRLGEDHQDVAQVYTLMGKCYEFHNVIDLAVESHKKALRINMKVLGEDHPEVAKTKETLRSLLPKYREYLNRRHMDYMQQNRKDHMA